jgi:hypothetical protein
MAFANSQARDELLAELAGSPPPRRVSAALRKAAVQDAAPPVLLLIALGFTGIGVLFTAFFFPWNIYQDWQLRAVDAGESQARVMAVTKTDMNIGGNKNTPGTPVMQYDFDFYTASGACTPNATRQGHAGTRGRWCWRGIDRKTRRSRASKGRGGVKPT